MPFEKIDVKAIIDEELKKDDFKASYERLKKEYDLIEQIVKVRKSMKITQEQLARSANVTQQAISRLEKEKHIPKMDTLMRIIDGLGMKLTLTER
ncbi:MAG: helix-turn-helix transcriptional regulator [Erysipelotrichaceae bacterium]